MGNEIIIGAALLPAVLLLLYILWQDRKNPEPILLTLKGVFYGILSAAVSLAISIPAIKFGLVPDTDSPTNAIDALKIAFGAAAIPEEVAKFIMLWLLLRKNKHFDERFDGIVYAVYIGLGFAGFENVLYVTGAGPSWMGTAIVRAFLSVPAHFFFAVLMGYYYSRVHFGHANPFNCLMVLLAPIVAHGIFDGLLFVARLDTVSDALSIVIMIMLLFFVNSLRKICTRHIREMVQRDRTYQRSYSRT